MFHVVTFYRDQRAVTVVERRYDPQRHAVFAGKLDGTRVQNFRAETRQFQHFLECHAVEFPRFRFDARVGRVDTVDISADLALVNAQCRRDGDRGRVRASAAKGRYPTVGADALEPRDYRDRTDIYVCAQAVWVNRFDTSASMGTVGLDRNLRAKIAAGGAAPFTQSHAQERYGHLLAAGQQDVHFVRVGFATDVIPKGFEPIGFAAHGGNDHHRSMTGTRERFDPVGNVADPLDIGHRRAAVFLDDQRHVSRAIR